MLIFHEHAFGKHHVIGSGLALFRYPFSAEPGYRVRTHQEGAETNQNARGSWLQVVSLLERQIFITDSDFEPPARYAMVVSPKNPSNIYPWMGRFRMETSNTPLPLTHHTLVERY